MAKFTLDSLKKLREENAKKKISVDLRNYNMSSNSEKRFRLIYDETLNEKFITLQKIMVRQMS